MAAAGNCDNVWHKLLEIYAAADECIMALMSLREPLFLRLVAVVQFACIAATAGQQKASDKLDLTCVLKKRGATSKESLFTCA